MRIRSHTEAKYGRKTEGERGEKREERDEEDIAVRCLFFRFRWTPPLIYLLRRSAVFIVRIVRRETATESAVGERGRARRGIGWSVSLY